MLTVRTFLRAFGPDWFRQMSGPVSVPFALAGAAVPGWAGSLLWLAAYVCLCFAAYALWQQGQKDIRDQKAKFAALEDKIVSRAAKQAVLMNLVALRNRGVNEIRKPAYNFKTKEEVAAWIPSVLQWLSDTVEELKNLSPVKAQQFSVLDNYKPTHLMTEYVCKDHGKYMCEHTEWLRRLNEIITEYEARLDAQV